MMIRENREKGDYSIFWMSVCIQVVLFDNSIRGKCRTERSCEF